MTVTSKALLLLTSVLAPASLSFGTSVTWYLNGVNFNDGATASGSFTFDAGTQTVSNWDISTTAGILPAFAYTPSDSSGGSYFQVSGYQNELLFFVNGSTRLLGMTPLAALTDTGGTVAINLQTWANGSGSDECDNCNPYRTIVSGSFQTTPPAPAPEPASTGLFGMAIAGLGVSASRIKSALRRRKSPGF